MLHFDYEDGYIPFPDLAGQELVSYTVTDPDGRIIEITPKNPAKHSSPDPMDNNPHYHYNLGMIIMNPDDIREDSSNNPQAQKNRELGKILTYIKNDYILELDLPDSPNYHNTCTEVVVQYTDTKNFTRTNIIKRRLES